jgi:Dimerisation domain
MSTNELPAAAQIFQMAAGKMITKPLYLAAKLGIADLLAAGPRPVEELASEVGAHAPSLYRLLRTLASVGVFSELGSAAFSSRPRPSSCGAAPPCAPWCCG